MDSQIVFVDGKSGRPSGNFILQINVDHTLQRLVPVMLLCFIFINLNAQSYDKLNCLEGQHVKTYYSAGTQEKAKRMATQLDKVIAFYNEHFQFIPEVTLLILSPADWSTYTKFPFYGMPHYTGNKLLIVAAEDNDYWRSLMPTAGKTPDKFKALVKRSYSDKQNQLTMEPFFDLLAIHELGHAYHNQGKLVMQRKWMSELFSNILLHTYIAEKEPLLLEALTTFPNLVVATTNKDSLKYTSLQDLETYYNDIGPNYPQNYGWYQCRWHMAAGDIYDKGGIESVKKLFLLLKQQKEILNDNDLIKMLTEKVHQSLGDVPREWDKK